MGRPSGVGEVVFALAFLVAATGALLVLAGLAWRTRASIPALGVVMLAVGAAVAIEVGVRPARRRGRPVRATLISGLGRVARGSRWLVGPKSRRR